MDEVGHIIEMVAKLRPNFFPFDKMVSKLKRESINQANKLYWRYHFIRNTLPVNRPFLVVSRVISQRMEKSARFTSAPAGCAVPTDCLYSSLAYSILTMPTVSVTSPALSRVEHRLMVFHAFCLESIGTLQTFLRKQFLLMKNFYRSKTFTLDIIAQNVWPTLIIQNQRSSKFECEWAMKSSTHNKRRKLIK